MLASSVYFRPELARMPKHCFGWARRALRGFIKAAPHKSRVPLLWGWATGIAAERHRAGDTEAGWMLLNQFDTYARPTALHRLRGEGLL